MNIVLGDMMHFFILSLGSYFACQKNVQLESPSEPPKVSSVSPEVTEESSIVSEGTSLISIKGMENIVLQSSDGTTYLPTEAAEGTYQLRWKPNETKNMPLIDVTLQKDKTVHVLCEASFLECKIFKISEHSSKVDQRELTSHFSINGLDDEEYYFIDPAYQIKYTQSPMPQGTYNLYVNFGQGFVLLATYPIEENQSITIDCDKAFMTCR